MTILCCYKMENRQQLRQHCRMQLLLPHVVTHFLKYGIFIETLIQDRNNSGKADGNR